MARTSLQPIRSVLLLAVLAHVLVGGLMWWWFVHHGEQKPKTKPTESTLAWFSPADFQTPAEPVSPPGAKEAPKLEPVKTAEIASTPITLPSLPPTALAPSSPSAIVPPSTPAPTSPIPTPSLDSDSKQKNGDEAKQSMLAVVGTEPPKPEKRPLPKAVAIDPAEAIALMKAQEELEAKAKAKENSIPLTAEPKKEPVKTPEKPHESSKQPLPPVLSGMKSEEAVKSPAKRPDSAVPITHEGNSDFLRFITVSRRNSTKPDEVPSLETVDRAIRNALLHTWSPPEPSTIPFNERTAEVSMAIDHQGHVQTFTLVKRSGNEDFDQSVRLAGHRLEKVQATLPDSFHSEHYEFQLHFHVE